MSFSVLIRSAITLQIKKIAVLAVNIETVKVWVLIQDKRCGTNSVSLRMSELNDHAVKLSQSPNSNKIWLCVVN
jgi:hypothetical protein